MCSSSFIELKDYTLKELSEKLGISILSQAEDILKRLILAGIAKPITKEKKDDWQDDALHGEFISGKIEQDTLFTLKFVGVIEIDGHVIKCYPKFIKKNDLKPSDLRPILEAIERYHSEHTELDTSLEDSSLRMSNQLSMALLLLRDYLSYGLYSNQLEELTLHGQGEIDWETTINTTMPIIQNNRPYYFDYYTNDIRQDDTDYISRLHARIITECSERLKSSELDEILQLETPMPYLGERIDFGTDEYIIQRLKKEMNIQFVSHKQILLRNLLAWIENTNLATDSSGIRMFGTNSFHTLWEAMCAEVFVSQYKQKLNSLGIPLADKFKGDATLESLIEMPLWQAIKNGLPNGEAHKAKDTLRPDFISIVKKNSHAHFVILDAKYYDITLNEKDVKGQPGVEDINKQYLYHLAYSPFIHAHSLTAINAFVSPTDEKKSYVAGTATMPIFAYIEKDDLTTPIKVVKLSASTVLDSYIAHTHLQLWEEVEELFPK